MMQTKKNLMIGPSFVGAKTDLRLIYTAKSPSFLSQKNSTFCTNWSIGSLPHLQKPENKNSMEPMCGDPART